MNEDGPAVAQVSRFGFVYSLKEKKAPSEAAIYQEGWSSGRGWQHAVVFHYCHKCDAGFAALFVKSVGSCSCRHGKMSPISFTTDGSEAIGRLAGTKPFHCEVCGDLSFRSTLVHRMNDIYMMCSIVCADVFRVIVPERSDVYMTLSDGVV